MSADAPVPPVKISAKVGRGVVFSFGDYFSLGLRGRMMLRYSFFEHAGQKTQEFTIRRARIYLAGHAFSKNILYYFHVAFANQDFEPDSRNPLYDANVTFTHLRDFQVLIGQQLVPYSRDRVISSNNAELVDRSIVNAELQLDRDLGVQFFSNDVGGLGGRLGYAVFVGMGDGRNQLVGNMGLLYTARLEVRPMGPFSDYTEADLDRTPTPKLAIGVAGAYNHDAVRQMGTLRSRYTLGDFDYAHGTADLIFKYRGLSFLAVGNLRWAKRDRYDGLDATGAAKTEYSRSAAGYSVQAGFVFPRNIGVAARWSQLFSLKDSTDPALLKTVRDQGKEIIAGLSWYIRGHILKVQGDYAYLYGDKLSDGRHQARVQLHVGY